MNKRDRVVRVLSDEPICGIYEIKNNVNGKIYIGQSIDIERRWNQHKYGKGSVILNNAIQKYGLDNFEFTILEEIEFTNKNDIIEKLTELEQKWFNEKEPFLKENGYNQNKTSKPNIPKNKAENFGEIISKIKIDNNHCGKPVKQYDLKGNFIKEWKSAAQIERILGFKAENISASCLRKSKTSNGFIWRFYDDNISVNDLTSINHRKKPITRKIKQLTLSGDIVKIWNTLKEITNNSDFDIRPIKSCCNNERVDYKGYKWGWL